ncbi:MAG: MBOAT family protein [Lachnospiraceae bacterium]|nr:MBOAT family protein [Lachnospiraceae bacterium]
MLLLVASLVFYGMADIRYPVFLIITSLTVYGAARWMEYYNQERKKYDQSIKSGEVPAPSREEKKAAHRLIAGKKKRVMLLCLFLNLGILAVVKYTNFVLQNLSYIFEKSGNEPFSFMDFIVPLGISFYTFQAVGYLLDVYWEKCGVQKNYFRFLLFLSFFPQLVQGPISRYHDLSETLYKKHDIDGKQIWFGLERILWGYFKKLVIADRVGVAVAALTESPNYYTGVYVLLSMLFYAIQLYADFTGGIDITIGIAQVLGIRMRENFIRPFFSKSIAEYWRRWHISMGTWFKDYVFYPCGISRPVKKVTTFCKKHFGMAVARRSAVYISSVLVWLATGIWHGAEWRFVIWGLLNGVIILLSEECEPLYQKFHRRFPKLTVTVFYRSFQVVRTFFLMSCLRLFDIYGSVRGTLRQFMNLFIRFSQRAVTKEELLGLGLSLADYVILGIGVILMFMVSMSGRRGSVREKISEKPYILRYMVFAGLFVSVILFGTYGQGYDVQQFIYNQF